MKNEEEFFGVECGCCDRPLRDGGSHINWRILSKRAEWEYPSVGNVAYDVPQEYAVALVCDECIEDGADAEYALRGEDLERVPIDELEDLEPMTERVPVGRQR